jgi:hypothetical protein
MDYPLELLRTVLDNPWILVGLVVFSVPVVNCTKNLLTDRSYGLEMERTIQGRLRGASRQRKTWTQSRQIGLLGLTVFLPVALWTTPSQVIITSLIAGLTLGLKWRALSLWLEEPVSH